jgi:hypothetical protein
MKMTGVHRTRAKHILTTFGAILGNFSGSCALPDDVSQKCVQRTSSHPVLTPQLGYDYASMSAIWYGTSSAQENKKCQQFPRFVSRPPADQHRDQHSQRSGKSLKREDRVLSVENFRWIVGRYEGRGPRGCSVNSPDGI